MSGDSEVTHGLWDLENYSVEELERLDGMNRAFRKSSRKDPSNQVEFVKYLLGQRLTPGKKMVRWQDFEILYRELVQDKSSPMDF